MELEVHVLIHILGQRIAIKLPGSLVGEVAQVFCLKLDAVYLVVAAQTVDYLLTFLGRQLVLSILISGKLPVEVFFRYLLAQLLLGTKALRNGEERHDRTVVDAVELYLVQHLEGIRERLGHISEHFVHLLAGLEPLLLGVAHAVRIVQVLAGGDAEQMVVRLGSLLVLEVAVVGAYELDAVFPGKLDEHLIRPLLQFVSLAVGEQARIIGHLVALQLQVIVIAEEIVIPLACLTGSGDIALQDLGWHLAGDTCRADDEVFVILLQVGTVGSRTHVVSIYPRIAHQLDEVLVSVIVLGEHDEVVATHIALVLLAVALGASCHIHLATDDGLEGFESLLLAVFVDLSTIVNQLLDAEHHTMIGYSHTLHAILDGLVHQTWNLGLAIEDGVLCMDV